MHPSCTRSFTIKPCNTQPTSIDLYTTTFGEIGLEYTIVGCPVLCQATINIDFLTVIVHEDSFELVEGPNSVMTHVKCVVEIVTDYNRELGIQGREEKPDSVWVERMRVYITKLKQGVCKHINRWCRGWVHEKLQ